jgi:hypothetical protein
MSDVSIPEPRRHELPAGWSPETFETVTDALAAALVAAYRRGAQDADALHDPDGPRPRVTNPPAEGTD